MRALSTSAHSLRFVGRSRELDGLDQFYDWRRDGALFILHGRPCVGKTRLLHHWRRRRDIRNAFFWTADDRDPQVQLREFEQALAHFAHRQEFDSPDASLLQDWGAAFRRIGDLAERSRERLVIVIDEFTHLVRADPVMPSTVQQAWDLRLQHIRGLRLILTGSLVHHVRRDMLSYESPLYHRATGVLQLKPLPFCWLSRLLPDLAPAERVVVYAVSGGVPGYLHTFIGADNIRAGLRQFLLPEGPLLTDLPSLLAGVPPGSEAILAAIAAGSHSPEEISRASGIRLKKLREWLYQLWYSGLVEDRQPVLTPGFSRERVFELCDAPLRFYYEFVADHIRQPPRNGNAMAAAVISRIVHRLSSFVERDTFAGIGRDWVWAVARRDRLGFVPIEVGSCSVASGNQPTDVPVLAINHDDRRMLVGDVWWRSRPAPKRALTDLLRRSRDLPPLAGDWKVQHISFTRGGFTPALKRTAARQGVRLLRLAQIERDLLAGERQPEPKWSEIPF